MAEIAGDWRRRSPPARKESFGSSGILRGLGCTSAAAAQAYSPAAAAAAAVRSSADWQGNLRRKKIKAPWKKNKVSHSNSSYCRNVVKTDIWCAPGIAADDSVECVVSQSQARIGGERNCVDRRGGRRTEHLCSFLDSLPATSDDSVECVVSQSQSRIGVERNCLDRRGGRRIEHQSSFLDFLPESAMDLPFLGPDQMPWRHSRRQFSHRLLSHGGLDEFMMLQSRILLSSTIDFYDQYRDLRLDVDSMSYEELLALGDKIGHVSTGLREEDIFQCLKKTRFGIFGCGAEKNCSICQEDFESGHELARLPCGHSYHVSCIRQWLLRKNTCPVCTAPASKS